MTKSIFHGSGYFMNDDRASGGKLAEDDILACAHHGGAMKKSDWRMKGGMCFNCSRPICHQCVAIAQRFGCQGPEEKKIEAAVNANYRAEQNAKLLGI